MYASNGTFLTGADGNSGEFARVNLTAPYTGTYYVRVSPRFDETYGGAYNLTVNVPGQPPSETVQQDETEVEDETDGGLPVLLIGVALVVLLFLAWWLLRGDDEPQ